MPYLPMAVGAQGERRRRCDVKMKAAGLGALGQALYIIHHLHFVAVISKAEPIQT